MGGAMRGGAVLILFFLANISSSSFALEYVASGKNSGHGNVVSIQPKMRAIDYQSPDRLAARIFSYLDLARARGWLGSKTIAVLPEFFGGWLVAADQSDSFYQLGSLDGAMWRLVASSPFSFLENWLGASAKNRAREAFFRLRAERMSELFQNVASAIAKKYEITLVPGSIVLPGAERRDGRLFIHSDQPLNNVSMVFGPNGVMTDRVVRKAFPISAEQEFLKAGPVEDLPVFDTPAGRLGVLICSDSWHPRSYQVMRDKRAEVLVAPAYLDEAGITRTPWKGYDGVANPSDVDPRDIGKLTEDQAWIKYALPGRLESSGARAGALVYLRGSFWGLGSDGASFLVNPSDSVPVRRAHEEESLLNLWL